MFKYDWKDDLLWFSYDKVFMVFKSKFIMHYLEWQRFILDQVETHFKFRPSTNISTY